MNSRDEKLASVHLLAVSTLSLWKGSRWWRPDGKPLCPVGLWTATSWHDSSRSGQCKISRGAPRSCCPEVACGRARPCQGRGYRAV